MNKREYKKINPDQWAKTDLPSLLKTVTDDLKSKGEDFKYWLSENFLEKFFDKLFREKFYSDICQLAYFLNEDQAVISSSLFEIAYSFSEVGNLKNSEYYYNTYLAAYGDNSAVFNNLGVIFEKKGELDAALKYYEKAKTQDPQDERASKNYSILKNKLLEKEQEEKEEKHALDSFKKENSYILNKFLSFCKHKRDDGLIVCSYKQLPQFLEISSQKAPDIIRDWLDKNYLKKVPSQDPSISCSVYKVNSFISAHLAALEKDLEKEADLLELCQRLNTSVLSSIGYDDSLITRLKEVVSDSDLESSLVRDIREDAMALLIRSYKASIVLSGSIVEAILLDSLKTKKIDKVQLKKGTTTVTKKLVELDLNELLEVARQNNLISESLLHLSHAVRGFRNVIHPGLEYRKSVAVTEENAMLAWSIVKKLICEISR